MRIMMKHHFEIHRGKPGYGHIDRYCGGCAYNVTETEAKEIKKNGGSYKVVLGAQSKPATQKREALKIDAPIEATKTKTTKSMRSKKIGADDGKN